jgi:hypothetical protein
VADDPLLDQLRALLEAARREGYERGYNDAVRRIVAAAGATGAEVAEPSSPPRAPRTPREAPAEGRRPRARRGSLEGRLVEILGQAPEGATIAEIEAAGSDDDEPLKVPSIRATLQRLLAVGRVEREGRRWHLAPGAGAESTPAEDSEEPAADEAPELAADHVTTEEAGWPA